MSVTDASAYFDANWKKYRRTIECNTLFHREMGEQLDKFLRGHLKDSFTLADIGCGDSSTIIPVLADKNITKYIGVDAAPHVLQIAADNTAQAPYKKEFICDNMIQAIKKLPVVDVIFTSYAVHHLSHEEKFNFVQDCYDKLTSNGFFIMVDGVLAKDQTREAWLTALAERMQTTQDMSNEELELRMQHPRAADHPEAIEVFDVMAKAQNWKKFEVLVDKGIFAFMVFSK